MSNHGTILLCESLSVASSQRPTLGGVIYIAKAAPKFRCNIYCSYFIDHPGVQDVEVIHTNSLECETTIKFWQRAVTADDMRYRGVDIFYIQDFMMNLKEGKHWFDLAVNGEVVSSTLLTVIP